MNNDTRIRVLYVEDNRDSFEMLKVMLGMSEIDVHSAQDVEEALTRAGSEKFDLYLIDSLQDGRGLGLCRTLRAVDPEIPVLFYSGNAHPQDIKMGMAAGAGGYITKPNSDTLAEAIRQLVTTRREPWPSFSDFFVRSASA